MTLKGKPVDANKTYKVAGWAPVAEGAQGEPVWDVVSAYLRDKKVIKGVKLNTPKIVGVARRTRDCSLRRFLFLSRILLHSQKKGASAPFLLKPSLAACPTRHSTPHAPVPSASRYCADKSFPLRERRPLPARCWLAQQMQGGKRRPVGVIADVVGRGVGELELRMETGKLDHPFQPVLLNRRLGQLPENR